MYAHRFKANYSLTRSAASLRAASPTRGSREMSHTTSDRSALDTSKVVCPKCGAEKWEKCFRSDSNPGLYRRYLKTSFHSERIEFAQDWNEDKDIVITNARCGQVYTRKVGDEYQTVRADGIHCWPVITSHSKEEAQTAHNRALFAFI